MTGCITTEIPATPPKSGAALKTDIIRKRENDEVMRKTKNNKVKWLHLRLSEDEHRQLKNAFAKTTERKISAYSRNILLGKPMISGYRNLTTEALITLFSQLIKELNGVTNNFNQAIHKLHTLRRLPEYSAWLVDYEKDRKIVLKDIQTIRDFINENAAQWLQS